MNTIQPGYGQRAYGVFETSVKTKPTKPAGAADEQETRPAKTDVVCFSGASRVAGEAETVADAAEESVSAEGSAAAQEAETAANAEESAGAEAPKAAGDAEDEAVSQSSGGKVAVNVGKRARQIAAAQNRSQVQQVIALLHQDMADCKAGLEKGWCDETEIDKVQALLNSAQGKLSQVPQKAEEEPGISAFDLASLM